MPLPEIYRDNSPTNNEVDKNRPSEIANFLFDINAVSIDFKKPFIFDSGIESPIYIDTRLLISFPKQRKIVENILLQKANSLNEVDVIAGVATGGITHAYSLANKLNLPMTYVRSSPKDHGRENQIEGIVNVNDKVLVVEDLISTGSSAKNAILALREKGANVENLLAIFTYNLKVADKNLQTLNIHLSTVLELKDILEVAKTRKTLNQNQINSIEYWQKRDYLN